MMIDAREAQILERTRPQNAEQQLFGVGSSDLSARDVVEQRAECGRVHNDWKPFD
jgi:hypothetical protein